MRGDGLVSVETPPAPARLEGLQALRGVAALLVVLFHAAQIWRVHSGADESVIAGPWDQGWAGVDLFFVISGFVMVWIGADIARGGRAAARFAWRRAARIYPLWWVFCSLMALYFWLTYGQPASPDIVGADGAWGYYAASLSLWPQSATPVLSVGWTLSFEIVFYALFALLLLLPGRARVPLILLWGAAILLSWAVLPATGLLPDDPLQVLYHPLSAEFAIGAGAAALLRWKPPGYALANAALVIGATIFAITLLHGVDTDQHDFMRRRVVVYGVSGGLILFGVAALERIDRLDVPRWLKGLGDVSYSLYLVHILVLLAMRRVLAVPGWLDSAGVAGFAGFVLLGAAASVLAAVVSYRLLERPLLRLMQGQR